MEDLISRENVMGRLLLHAAALADVELFSIASGIEDAMSVVRDAPAVDAEPVRHGRWEKAKAAFHKKCSCCGSVLHMPRERNYCPDCGAKMDLD